MVTILREADTIPVPDLALLGYGRSVSRMIYSWRKHFGRSVQPSDV